MSGMGLSLQRKLKRLGGHACLHGRRQNQRHLHFGGKSSQDLDILLQHCVINGVHPATCPDLVIDENHGRVRYVKCFVETFLGRRWSHGYCLLQWKCRDNDKADRDLR
jgi:hypothetical protein